MTVAFRLDRKGPRCSAKVLERRADNDTVIAEQESAITIPAKDLCASGVARNSHPNVTGMWFFFHFLLDAGSAIPIVSGCLWLWQQRKRLSVLSLLDGRT